jgi:5-(carboxyamino)imidazole ribonucleotide synthase
VTHVRVGMVGAGQLARMTYEAAGPLAIPMRLLAAREDDSAAKIATDVLIGPPDAESALRRLAEGVDVVTFDHELVDLGILERLEADGHTLRPSARTLGVATDKRAQRDVLGGAGVAIAPSADVDSAEDVRAVASEHGWPLVVKAVRGGYDGRGVWTVGSEDDAVAVMEDAAQAGLRLFAEPLLDIERELAVIVASGPSGQRVVYPPVETIQVEGICHEVLAPARVSRELADEAVRLGELIARTVGSVGILAIELFVVDGRLLLNELAARPHNSGHLTIEAAVTSQFENHLRGVLDMTLGDPSLIAPVAAMANIIGTPDTGDPHHRLADALAVRGAHIHLYDKEPRPGRKIGHVTVVGGGLGDVRERARSAAQILAGGPMGGPR